MLTLRIAWRNLWRNNRRTAITFAALSLNTAVLIASFALMLGMLDDLVRNATDLVVGQVQVHHPKYRSERSIYDTVIKPGDILQAAASAGIAASPRAYGFGLVSHGKNSAGARFCGVFPEKEKKTVELYKHLLAGNYLPDKPGKKLVLGRKLAKTLEVKVGDEIIVVVQAADGSMGNDIYHVAGILKSMGEGIDRTLAMVHYKDMEDLFALNGTFHEIVLNSSGKMPEDKVAAAILPSAKGNEVMTWRQLMPPLNDMLNAMNGMLILFGAIFFLAAGLGVMNTMLMSTFERIREFGLLKAIGATPWRIIKEVSAEALLLGVASTLAGGAIGTFLAWYFQYHPIDLTGFAPDGISAMGVAMNPEWRATLSPETVWMPIVVMWIISLLAVLWPAVRAARLDPVKALVQV
ncbi:MAG: ABC transporter permease [Deltaproteobacteria bacterium]|nr:ABC transporter permease [Deltaproteobacteria bacterium]